MTEDDIIDEVIDDKTVLSWFHESNNGIFSNNLEEKCKKLMEVLPSLPQGLGDIDDLIYYEYVKPNDAKEIKFSNEVLHHIYINLRYYYRLQAGSPSHYSAHVTLLKILHLAPKHMFDELKRGEIFRDLCRQAATRIILGDYHLEQCCCAVKLLRVIFMKDKQLMAAILSEGDQTFIMHLPKYRDLPSAKHPDKSRLTTWMSIQASILIEDSVLINRKLYFDESRDVLKSLLKQNELENYVFYLLDKSLYYNNLKDSLKHIFAHNYEYVHDYFSSAKSYDEKVERIKAFIKGSVKHAKTWSSPEEWLKHQYNRNLDIRYEYRFLALAKGIVKSFARYLLNKKLGPALEKINKLHPFTIKPYLSEDDVNNQLQALNIADGNELEQINGRYEEIIIDGEDLTIDKYLFYDKFVKHLEVVNMLHATIMMCPEFVDNFVEGDERMVFNVIHDINFNSLFKSVEVRDNWLMKMAIKNCPYLFLGRHQQYLADDLMKLKNGEKLSDDNFEELFYAVNSSSNGFIPVHDDDRDDDFKIGR